MGKKKRTEYVRFKPFPEDFGYYYAEDQKS